MSLQVEFEIWNVRSWYFFHHFKIICWKIKQRLINTVWSSIRCHTWPILRLFFADCWGFNLLHIHENAWFVINFILCENKWWVHVIFKPWFAQKRGNIFMYPVILVTVLKMIFIKLIWATIHFCVIFDNERQFKKYILSISVELIHVYFDNINGSACCHCYRTYLVWTMLGMKKTQMSIFISSYFLLKDTLWHYSRCITASKCRMQSNHKARVVIVREHTWYG